MQVTFRTTFGDYKAAQILHAKRSMIPYLIHCVGHYLYPILGICILVFEFTPRHIAGSPHPKLLSTLCALLLVCIPIYLRFMMRRCFNRTRTATGDCTIDFNEEGIRARGLDTKSEVGWSAIQSFSEDSKTFLLYLAPARFLPVPKRFCTDEQIKELRLLLQGQVKSPGR
jgi:hypothetical protein